MSVQTSACFKKEIQAFTRTKRLLIIILILIGWAMVAPLLIRSLGVAMDVFAPVYDELGMDVSGMSELFATNVSTGVIPAVSDLTTTGLIAFLILINGFAGGEQKKRSIMIPKSAGLRSFGYLFPKYIIYPLTAIVLAIIAAFVSWGASIIVFEVNDITAQGVFRGGMLAGVSLMFYICMHLTLGTATGKAGMSSVICIVASLLLPNLFAVLGAQQVYNPFMLNMMAVSALADDAMHRLMAQEIFATVLVALILMVMLYFVALFVQNAKKIDNSGNAISL
ncbi:MAG: hypothetical protein FWC66_03010 [Oscillospiraceae bacterium]|nr:hypothetical protein [Oscillospiraceae bacterium]